MDQKKIKLIVAGSVLAVLAIIVVYVNFFRSGAPTVAPEVAQKAAAVVDEALKEDPPPPPPPPVQRHGTSSLKK